MSERFGIPDHDAQIPDHAPQNPTPQGSFGGTGGFDVPAYNPPIYGGGGGTAGTYNAYSTYTPRRLLKRSMIVGVVLATVLGPLGLFYVNLLNGIVALVIFVPVIRFLAAIIGVRPGGDMTAVALVVIMWCITIPWSIIGVKIHNARIQSD